MGTSLGRPQGGRGRPEDFLEEEGSTLGCRRGQWAADLGPGDRSFKAGGEGLSVEGQGSWRLGYHACVGVRLSLWWGASMRQKGERVFSSGGPCPWPHAACCRPLGLGAGQVGGAPQPCCLAMGKMLVGGEWRVARVGDPARALGTESSQPGAGWWGQVGRCWSGQPLGRLSVSAVDLELQSQKPLGSHSLQPESRAQCWAGTW